MPLAPYAGRPTAVVLRMIFRWAFSWRSSGVLCAPLLAATLAATLATSAALIFAAPAAQAQATASFEGSGGFEVREGEVVTLTVTVVPAPATKLNLSYRVAADASDGTGADASDYSDPGDGVVTIAAGETTVEVILSITDDDDIEPTRESFEVSLTPGVGYRPVFPTTASVVIKEGTCDRTPQVRNRVLRAISRVDDCAEVTDGDLSAVTRILDLSDADLDVLKAGDFSGLDGLRQLYLYGNRLTILPATVFSGLDALRQLHLYDNRLSTLPATVFSELGNLRHLRLYGNRLSTLPATVFSGLGSLEGLWLYDNRLSTLPATVFSGLGNLTWLRLQGNRLSTLPENVFSGLGKLTQLWLQDNPGAPFVFAGSRLEQVGVPARSTPDAVEVKLIVERPVPTGITVGLSAEGGELQSTETVIPKGSSESAAFTVTQVAGAAVTLRASTGVMTGYSGIGTAASELVLDLVAPSVSGVIISSAPAHSRTAYWTVAGETIRVEVGFGEAVEVSATGAGPSLTLTIGETTRAATYAPSLSTVSTLVFVYVLQAGDADEDGISIEDDALVLAGARITDVGGHQPESVSLGGRSISNAASHRVIRGEFRLSFAAPGLVFEVEEGDAVDLLVVVSPPAATKLNLSYSVAAADDPDGADMDASGGAGADASDYSDPGGGDVTIAAGATSVEVVLSITDDDDIEPARESFEVSLTPGVGYRPVFPATASVIIKEGICDRTPQVQRRILGRIIGVNACAEVTDDDLSAVTGVLNLSDVDLEVLKAGDFSGLDDLRQLHLYGNRLSTLPATVFSGLGNLRQLHLYNNRLSTLPATVFSGLGNLRHLRLHRNRLSTLPATVFSGLGKLESLWLYDNRLSALPATVFSGLGNLIWLSLHDNPGAPFVFADSRFEQVGVPAPSTPGAVEVKLVVGRTAPTGIVVGLSAEGGELQRTETAIPKGSSESAAFTVTQITGSAMTLRASTGVMVNYSGIETAASELVLDLVGPSVSDVEIVSRPSLGDAYLASSGEVIRVAVVFDEAVEVTVSAGGPFLVLTVGATTRVANYVPELSSTSTLTFTYTPQAGDVAAAGISVGADALRLAGAVITDVSMSRRPPESTSLGRHAILDAAGHRVFGRSLRFEPPLVSEVGESGTANLIVSVSPASATGVSVNYRIGTDAAPDTADADASDYSIPSLGSVTIEANETSAVLSVPMIDDAEVEPTREWLMVSLRSGEGYALVFPATALVVIKEGICDRTAQVRDGILEKIIGVGLGIDDCAEVTDDDLSEVTGGLDLSSTGIDTLNADDFSGLDGLNGLDLSSNRLTALPENVFSSLGNLEVLNLAHNPGVPFVFARSRLERTGASGPPVPGVAEVKLVVDQIAPTTMTAKLSAEGGELSLGAAVIDKGSSESRPFTVTQASGVPVVTLRASTGALTAYSGVGVAASELVLDLVGPSVSGLMIGSTPVHGGSAYWAAGGETIRVEVGFGEEVEVSTTIAGPSLTLTIGETTRAATYVPSLSVASTLVFAYTLQSGDADEDGVGIGEDALVLAGARITDLSGNQISDPGLGGRSILNAAGHGVIEGEFRLSFDAVAGLVFEVEEGGVVNLPVAVAPAPAASLNANYRIGADDDFHTADADASDYSGPGFGNLRIGANRTTAAIAVSIIDDAEVEPTSESFTVSLTPGSGYVLASPATVRVVIKEGVCDRTPQVRDKILEAIVGVDACAEVTDDDLSALTGDLNLIFTGIFALDGGDFSGLVNLGGLFLGFNRLSTLPGGAFSSLANLETLDLSNNSLSTLPGDAFSGLGNLKRLLLDSSPLNNNLLTLPDGVFSGLGNLLELSLRFNRLSTLPDDVFSGLGNLNRLHLDSNQLTTLPDGVFSGLGNLLELSLRFNRLVALPDDVFSGLGNLSQLSLWGNRLRTLPENMFSDLGNLTQLELQGNPGTPFEFAGSQFTRVAESGPPASGVAEVKLVVDQIAPTTITVGLSAEGGATSVVEAVILKGNAESSPFTVTQAAGATVTLRASPGVMAGYFGIQTAASELVLDLVGPSVSGVNLLSAPAHDGAYLATDGEVILVGVGFDEAVEVSTSTAGPSLTLAIGGTTRAATYAPSLSQVTTLASTLVFAYVLQAGDADEDGIGVDSDALRLAGAAITDLSGNSMQSASLESHAIHDAAGHRVVERGLRFAPPIVLEAGEGDVVSLIVVATSVTATDLDVGYGIGADADPDPGSGSADADASDYSDPGAGVVTIAAGETTAEIILSIIDDDEIEPTRESFTVSLRPVVGGELIFPAATVVVIKEGVCDRTLQVRDEILLEIGGDCAEVTDDGLSKLREVLDLSFTGIDTLSADDFSGLDDLRQLHLYGNRLSTLPATVFSGLGNLEGLRLDDNRLSTLPATVFSDLGNLRQLHLYGNRLSTLPATVFSGLGNLRQLRLYSNRLSTLPATVFSDLGNLRHLRLHDNHLSTLPGTVFSDLGNLESLWLSDNRLSVLPATVFSGLGNLIWLYLHGNRLSALPENVFSGLGKLVQLRLHDNPGAPFVFADSRLEQVGVPSPSMPDAVRVKLVVERPALKRITVGLSAEGGELQHTETAIPKGRSESAAFTVTQITGAAMTLRASTGVMVDYSGIETAASELVLDLVGPSVSDVEIVSRPSLGDAYLASSGEVIRVAVVFDEAVEVTASAGGPFLVLTVGATTRVAHYASELSSTSTLTFTYTPQAGDVAAAGIGVGADALRLAGAVITDVSMSRRPPESTSLGRHAILDAAGHRVFGRSLRFEPPLVSEVGESGTASLIVSVSPASATGVSVNYRIGADAAPDTADADASDYSIPSLGSVTIEANETTAVLSVPIIDDAEVEPTREWLMVSLRSGEGYALAFPATALVVIKEGICNRTAQVRDGILEEIIGLGIGVGIGVDECAEVTDDDLSKVTGILDLSSTGIDTLSAGDFSGLDGLTGLDLSSNRLTALPENVFSSLGNLEALNLAHNPGAPFVFARSRLERTGASGPPVPGVAEVKLVVDQTAPTTMTAKLSAEGGELSLGAAVIDKGSSESSPFTVTQAAGAPVTLRASSGVLAGYFGIQTAASELVLDLVAPSVSGVNLLSAPAHGDAYLATDGEVILVAVGFDEAVEVSTSTAGPSLTLTIGETTRVASYASSLSEASTLVFTYVLQAGDADEDGIGVGSDALRLAGAAITDLSGNSMKSASLGSHAIHNVAGHRVVERGLRFVPPIVSEVGESDVVSLIISVSLASATSLSVNYRIGADAAPDTADADVSDYSVPSLGSVTIEANETSAVLSVPIIDDAEVEPTREWLMVSLRSGEGYALVFPTTALVVIKEGICDRTAQVRDEILEAIIDVGVDDCAEVTDDDLSALTEVLDLSSTGIDTLSAGDFSGLDGLTGLDLSSNRLTTLPENVFSSLGNLEALNLGSNRLSTLPATVFSGLGNLATLNLGSNRLSTLSATVFSDLGSLNNLELSSNRLSALPENVFSSLGNLEALHLSYNPGAPFVFAGSQLEQVGVPDPSMPDVAEVKLVVDQTAPTTMTAGLSAEGGATSIAEAVIPKGNAESSPFTVTQAAGAAVTLRASPGVLAGYFGIQTAASELVLDLVGPSVSGVNLLSAPAHDGAYLATDGEVILVAVGFDEAVEVSTSTAGPSLTLTIGGTTRAATYAPGLSQVTTLASTLVFAYVLQGGDADEDGIGVDSDALRLAGAAITDLSGNPMKSASLGSHAIPNAAGHRVVERELRFVPPLVSEAGESDVVSLIVSVSPVSATSLSVNYRIGADAAPDTADADASDYSVPSLGSVTIEADETTAVLSVPMIDDAEVEPTREWLMVSLRSGDGYVLAFPATALVVIKEGICDRTAQVRDGILEAIIDVGLGIGISIDDCAEVTDGDLSALTGVLDLSFTGIDTLSADDFSGLDGLTGLDLSSNRLTALPENVFSSLDNLEALNLGSNRLSSLPAAVFSGLDNLTTLNLGSNRLSALPAAVFSGLGDLAALNLGSNRLSTLPATVFSGLGNLATLNLGSNRLIALPATVFSGLGNLATLNLGSNRLSTLPAAVFSDLGSLNSLELSSNRLSTLPAAVFSDLGSLNSLELSSNRLSTLPENVFSSLDNLEALHLSYNPGAPFVFAGSQLEQAGVPDPSTPDVAGVKLVVDRTAPTTMTAGLSAEGGATSVPEATIPKGRTESEVFTVTQAAGAAVTLKASSGVVTGYSGVEIAASELVLDLVGPSVSGVSIVSRPVSGDAYLAADGEAIHVAVVFDEAVKASTTITSPSLTLTIGRSTRPAVYTPDSSKSSTLVFSYALQAVDDDDDGVSIEEDALVLAGARITDLSGNQLKSVSLGSHAVLNAAGHQVIGRSFRLRVRVFLEGALE